MIKSFFNPIKNQLDVVYSGRVTIVELLDYINEVKNNKDLPRRLKIYTIAQNIEMDFKPEDLGKIVGAVMESIKNYKFMIDAFVVDKSKETAFSILFKSMSEQENYKFNVFSSTKAAEQWLSYFK